MLWAMVAMTFPGWLATLAGCYVTETGRQPWLVTGVPSPKAAAADVPAATVMGTLVTYLALRLALRAAHVSAILYSARRDAKGAPVPTMESPGSGVVEAELTTRLTSGGGRSGSALTSAE